MTAAAYAACGMILAGCAAWAFSGPLAAAILRARWAWHCRGRQPVRADGEPLSCDEIRKLAGILHRERSRT